MEFDVYQTLADLTAQYPEKKQLGGITYSVLGLAGEAGEVAGKVKKILRGDKVYSEAVRDALVDELGDVLWYVAAVATNLDINLEDVADRNLRKLQSRQARGVIKGSGDTR